MSLFEILPVVQTLSRGEKLRLIELLAKDLSQGEQPMPETPLACEVWSPCTDFTGARMLAAFLETQGKTP